MDNKLNLLLFALIVFNIGSGYVYVTRKATNAPSSPQASTVAAPISLYSSADEALAEPVPAIHYTLPSAENWKN